MTNLMLTITNHYNYTVCIGMGVQQLDQLGIIFPENLAFGPRNSVPDNHVQNGSHLLPCHRPALSVLLSVSLGVLCIFFFLSILGSPTLLPLFSFPICYFVSFTSLLPHKPPKFNCCNFAFTL